MRSSPGIAKSASQDRPTGCPGLSRAEGGAYWQPWRLAFSSFNLWIFALATGGSLASVKAGSGLYQDALPNCCCHLDFEKTYPKRAKTQLRSSP